VIIKYTNKEIKVFAVASSIAQEVLRNIRTVTAFHEQWKEEQRCVPNKHAHRFIFNNESSRFADNLIVAKKIREKKVSTWAYVKAFQISLYLRPSRLHSGNNTTSQYTFQQTVIHSLGTAHNLFEPIVNII
jgi:hypothetical protein